MLIHINPLYNLNNQGAPFFIANHVHVPCPIHPKMLLIGRWLRSFGSFAFTLTWTEAAGDPLLLLLRTGNYQPNWCFGFERMSSIDERLMLQWVAPWKLLNTCNTVCAMTLRDIVSELLLNTFASHLDSTGPFWNLPCCAFALPFLATSNHDLCGENNHFSWCKVNSLESGAIFLLNLINYLGIWIST